MEREHPLGKPAGFCTNGGGAAIQANPSDKKIYFCVDKYTKMYYNTI
jgi:hypothetical protein